MENSLKNLLLLEIRYSMRQFQYWTDIREILAYTASTELESRGGEGGIIGFSLICASSQNFKYLICQRPLPLFLQFTKLTFPEFREKTFMRQSEPRHVNWERNLLKTSFAILQSRGKLKQLGETLSRRSPGTNWTCSQHPFFGEYFIIMMKNSNRTKLPCAGKLKYILFHLFKILTGQNLFIFSYSWKVVESPVYPP